MVTHELNPVFIIMCQAQGLCVKVVLITSADIFHLSFTGGKNTPFDNLLDVGNTLEYQLA